MNSVTSGILEKYLISDPVVWNNGCISQGRLTAVTNIPKSPRLSTAMLCFSFTVQTVKHVWGILGAGPGNGTPPFCLQYGLWLHLNGRGLGPFSTVARKKGRNRAIGEHQLSLPRRNSHLSAVSLAPPGTFKQPLVRGACGEAHSPEHTALSTSGHAKQLVHCLILRQQISAAGVSNTHHSPNKALWVHCLGSQALAVHDIFWCH